MYWRVIIITSLVIITCDVIESHSHHPTKINVNVKKSWLTTAEFVKYLQLSLNVSRCTNVHIHGTSETTITHLKNFVRSYPNTYFVGDKHDECTGYLMISTTVRGIVGAIKLIGNHSKIATTEILIIVDQSVTKPCVLLFPKIYHNMNVKIMSPNDRWYLSKNYLKPRVFKKVQSFEELKYDTGIANLQGRELVTAAYDDPPRIYINIDKTVNRFSAGPNTYSKKPKFDGINLKLFIMIVERLNATFKIKTLGRTKLDRFEDHENSPWFKKTVIQVLRKNLDIGLTKVWRNRWEFPEYFFHNILTIPFTKNDVHFLVPRPKMRTSLWAPVTPFNPIVWVSIIIVLIAQSLFVYTKARLLPTRFSKKFESFAMTWIEMMGRLLNTTAPNIIPGFKITFQLWSVASILLLTAYSSDLASKLTSPSYEKRIDTPKDFIEANLSWGNGGKEPNFYFYYDTEDPYLEHIKSRFVNETDEELRRHRKGNYAIIGTVTGDVFFPERPVSSADLKGYRLMKQAVASLDASFAVQPWLLNSVNKIILLLFEFGFVDYHVRNVIVRHTDSALREVLIEREDKYERPQVLSLKPLSICFGFLILGLLISTVVFILEILSFTGPQKSVLQVLMDIKKKREISNFRKEKKNRVFCRFKFKR